MENDLERTNISSTDLLGCINDYCENQSFNTIIVANEQKIKDSSDNELSYHEIKEKIVRRVIQFVPDYGEVVSNSIELMSCGIEYKGLLRRNKKLLVKVLSGDFNDNVIIEQYKAENYKFSGNKKREEYQKEEENLRNLLVQRPHNIRSFKCAIQDFERVYDKLVKAGIQDGSKWLLSFVCLMMTNKAGLIQENPRYGNLFRYLNVEKLYPEVFDSNFILNGVSKWIIYGEWNDEIISKEIQLFLEKEKAVTPLEILGIWGQYSNSLEIDRQTTTVSLKKLRDDLNSAMQQYKEKSKNIAARHTQNFIEKLDAIIKTESEDTLGE